MIIGKICAIAKGLMPILSCGNLEKVKMEIKARL